MQVKCRRADIDERTGIVEENEEQRGVLEDFPGIHTEQRVDYKDAPEQD